MMKRITYIGILSIILTSLTCCEREELSGLDSDDIKISLNDVQKTKGPGQKAEVIKRMSFSDSLFLTVKKTVNPVQVQETKASNITTRSFTELYGTRGFNVYAEKHGNVSTTLFSNKIFRLDNMFWRPETMTPWPEYAADYYAWAPSEVAALSSSNKSFAYTVSPDNESQIDLLVAKAQTPENYTGSLPMTFQHALCEIRFTINERKTVGSFYSLKIKNLKMNGTYDFSTGKWSIPGDAQVGDVTLDLSSSPVAFDNSSSEGDAITSESQTFFVIPQIVAPGSSTVIELQFKGKYDSEPKTYCIDFEDGIEFESGKCLNFSIGHSSTDYHFTLEKSYQEPIYLTNDVENSNEILIPVTSLSYDLDEWSEEDLEEFLNNNNPSDYEDNGLVSANWNIKSYVMNGVTKDYSEDALKTDAGLDVKFVDPDDDEVGMSLSVIGLARDALENHLATNGTWTGSQGKWSPEDWSDKGVIDLSRMDVKKDTYAESVNAFRMTTANCYVIRHAGHYKFPLVYGNAMNKGAVDKESYDMSDKNLTWDDRFLEQFVNHLGQPVTSPFIEQSEDFTLASGEDACEILWQDQAEIVRIDGIAQESVEIVNADGSPATIPVSYIYITIPQDIICQNNALICVKDTDGKIVWSWHIWTTNNPALLDSEKEVTSTDYYDHYYFHPMNSIGWIDPSLTCPGRDDVEIVLEQETSGKELRILIKQPETTSTSGMVYYQWGRKDPIPNKGISALGEEELAQGSIESDNIDSSVIEVQESILNPTHFFYNESASSGSWHNFWEKGNYINLWGGLAYSYYFNYEGEYDQLKSNLYHKTIYDPSPIGYKVPAPPAFSAFINVEYEAESTIYHEFNKGCTFSNVPYSDGFEFNPDNNANIFFAASGFRSYSENGMVKERNSALGYWYCTVESMVPFTTYHYMYGYMDIMNPFAFFDENGLERTDDIKTAQQKKSFTERYLDYYEILFKAQYNLGNGVPVRPVLYERFDNEPHFEGNTVEPYENEYYTIEG